MIVDDDSDLQAVLQTMLEANGYACFCVGSVKAALQRLKSDRPSLVILDLELPEENGAAFLKHAADWLPADTAPPPVIVLSGFDNPVITNYTLKKGAVSFIKKPYDINYLLGMIDAFIEAA